MKKHLLTLVCILLFTSAFGAPQRKITPSELWMYGPINFFQPVMIDSTDVKGKKYTDDNLLSTAVNFPAQERFTHVIKTDTAGYFRLPKPAADNAFYLVSFYVSGNKYNKGKITVKSPNRFELYINDKKETDKKINDLIKNIEKETNIKNNDLIKIIEKETNKKINEKNKTTGN